MPMQNGKMTSAEKTVHIQELARENHSLKGRIGRLEESIETIRHAADSDAIATKYQQGKLEEMQAILSAVVPGYRSGISFDESQDREIVHLKGVIEGLRQKQS